MSLRSLIADSKTIGFKLAFWYSAFFVLSASLLFGLAYFFLSQTLQRDDHKAIQSQVKEVVELYANGGLAAVTSQVKSELLESKKFRKRTHFFFRFATRDNNTKHIFFPKQWSEFNFDRLEAISPTSKKWITVPPEGSQDDFLLELTSKRLPDGTWLQVGMSTESRQRVLGRFLESFMYAVSFLLLVGFASGYSMSRRALRPIRHLIQTVQSIELGQMDARVPQTKADDELEELIRLFNNMLAKIESLIEGMKGSLDNVAHELKTPMTRMQNVAESALRSEGSPEKYREALENCLEESNRMLKMLDTLMDISEAETGVMSLGLQKFPMQEMIEPVVDVYSFVAEEKDLSIQTNIQENQKIHADFNRMSQVLANLLDNAIKYTPPGSSPIKVQTWTDNAGAVISVADSGQGISEQELPKIWDRLYRGVGSSHESGKGFGLGLAQVKAILEAHNAWVDVHSTLGKGTIFQVHIPQ